MKVGGDLWGDKWKEVHCRLIFLELGLPRSCLGVFENWEPLRLVYLQ